MAGPESGQNLLARAVGPAQLGRLIGVDAVVSMTVSEQFAELAHDLRVQTDADGALTRMLDLVVEHAPGADYASVTTCRKSPRALASTAPMATRAEKAQRDGRQGPGYACIEDRWVYVIGDLATDPRWPGFAKDVLAATTVRSLAAVPLPAPTAACLTVFSEQPNSFTDSAIGQITTLAAHVSTLVALHEAAEEAANLQIALASNRDIGVAIGILMAQRRVTAEAAYDQLKQASQDLHRKLHDIAGDVMLTGTLPVR
jgi:GAF domain-containing protein